MKFPFINDPNTDKPDEFVTLTVLVTLATIARFLLDGVTLHILGQVLVFSKVDASVYIALLSPVWGAHAYTKGKTIDGTKS